MFARVQHLTVRWKLFYSYTIFLVLLSVLPINSSGSSVNHTYVIHVRLDYLLHAAIFIPWMYLMQRLTGVGFETNIVQTLMLILAGLAFGLANEAVQYLLPYRAFNINDLIANGLGVILGSAVFWVPSLLACLRQAGNPKESE